MLHGDEPGWVVAVEDVNEAPEKITAEANHL